MIVNESQAGKRAAHIGYLLHKHKMYPALFAIYDLEYEYGGLF